jgi:ABC-2 type transport system ATP-binding protein
LHDPQVLLLDEPASGLDPRARIKIRRLIKKLGEMGKTVMVSSHILPELADICNKVGMIEQGVLKVNASVEDVLRQVRRQTVLNIDVAEGREAAAKLLSQQPIVDQVQANGSHLVVTLREGIREYADLADVLIRNDYKLTLLREEELNLETAFMALTKGTTA